MKEERISLTKLYVDNNLSVATFNSRSVFSEVKRVNLGKVSPILR